MNTSWRATNAINPLVASGTLTKTTACLHQKLGTTVGRYLKCTHSTTSINKCSTICQRPCGVQSPLACGQPLAKMHLLACTTSSTKSCQHSASTKTRCSNPIGISPTHFSRPISTTAYCSPMKCSMLLPKRFPMAKFQSIVPKVSFVRFLVGANTSGIVIGVGCPTTRNAIICKRTDHCRHCSQTQKRHK